MTNSSIHIREIAHKDISEVELILGLQFGEGYMNASTLEKYVSSFSYNGLVATNNNTIVGAAFARFFPIDQVKNKVNLETDHIQELFPTQTQIGITNSMAILPGNTGKGIGFALMKERMIWFKQNCNAAICMCWAESNGGMEKLLIKNDFNYIKTIPEYWKKDSIDNHFNCIRCGEPPCICSGKLYVKCF